MDGYGQIPDGWLKDDIPANLDEWVEEGKFHISPEHDFSDKDDVCEEGCDWCMAVIDTLFVIKDVISDI